MHRSVSSNYPCSPLALSDRGAAFNQCHGWLGMLLFQLCAGMHAFISEDSQADLSLCYFIFYFCQHRC